MWQKCRTLVAGVNRPMRRSASSSSEAGGTGNETFVSVIPSRLTRCSQVSSMRP